MESLQSGQYRNYVIIFALAGLTLRSPYESIGITSDLSEM